jgi:hypothetical protein
MIAAVLLAALLSPPGAADLTRPLLHTITYPGSLRSRKGPTYHRHCREAPGGCVARVRRFAALILWAAHRHRVSQTLLASMALRESGLNPWAVGPGGERGLLQIHPSNRMAHRVTFHKRPECARRSDACQWEVIDAAAELLASAIRVCRSVESGLTMYWSGRCGSSGYAARVIATRNHMEASGV